mgnify:CR=1 FL=1
MKNIKNYNLLRDNLAMGIARMAEVFEQNNNYNKDFEDAFEYTLIQLKKFDDIFNNFFNFPS